MGRGGPGGDPRGGPCPRRKSLVAVDTDGGMADGAAVNVNGTELGAQEWRDALLLIYGLDPPDLPKYCDSCNSHIYI